MSAAEVIDLGATSAWARIAHLPEVVVRAKLREMVGGHVLQPVIPRFDVAGDAAFALEHGHEELVGRDLPRDGEQFPREADRLFLEVVAEREVAEHLKERVMARRRPDVLEIVVLAADAHALLRSGGALVVALFFTEEDVLELVHPRVCEEQRGIILRHERRALHDAMAVPLEILQKGRANLSPGHVCGYFTLETTKARRHEGTRPRAARRRREVDLVLCVFAPLRKNVQMASAWTCF